MILKHRILTIVRIWREEDVPKELVHFLEYFEKSTDKYVATVSEDSIRTLHEKVTTLKKSGEWEAGYMKFEKFMSLQKEESFEKGRLEMLGLLLSELFVERM